MTAPQTDGRPLTPREAAFVAWYLVLRNATEAYRRAGFEATTSANRNASRLMRRAVIVDAIAAAEADIAAQTGAQTAAVIGAVADLAAKEAITRQWVIDELKEAVATAKAQPVYQGSTVVASLKLLGTEIGMFKERHELTGANGGPIQTEDVTEQTRERLAGRLARLAERN